MKYKILLIIFAIGLVSSLILAISPVSQICDPNKGCDVIQNSPYAYTFGLKNSYYGVFAFTILGLITLAHLKKPNKKTKNIVHIGLIVGSIVSIYFLYLQYAVLKAYCKYCLVVDISLLTGLIITLFMWEK